MNTADCLAHQVVAGDQVWRSDELGRGFVERADRDLLGRVVLTWEDGVPTTHRRSEPMVRKEV